MRGRTQPFSQPLARPKKLDPETHPWWWNPSRLGVKGPPRDFAKKLAEFDSQLACTWNPVSEHWQIWFRKPSIQSPVAQGWLLLFNVPPRALDERVFARLYSASSRQWGNGKAYFDRIQAEFERDAEKREENHQDFARTVARDQWDYSQIKVSMYGPSTGSKFSEFHSE